MSVKKLSTDLSFFSPQRRTKSAVAALALSLALPVDSLATEINAVEKNAVEKIAANNTASAANCAFATNSTAKLSNIDKGSWQLLARSPRPANLFTQGLVFVDGTVYESVGMRGRSALLEYHADRSEIARRFDNRADVHAEGLVFLNEFFYQGSWLSREIYVLDRDFLQLRTLIAPTREVWGITTDGRELIITDSGCDLIYLDPTSGEETKRVTVRDEQGNTVRWLNELEWVDGLILANIWHSYEVLAIDPQTGLIKKRYDFSELKAAITPFVPQGEQVFNGLAWDSAKRELIVTGKEWPFWFTVQLDPDDKKDSAH